MSQSILTAISVRMYYTGFGDCLLLTFRYKDTLPKTLWIDFGARGGKKERMIAIALDMKEYLTKLYGEPRLDVLAITHEHQDHISGFRQAREVLDDISIAELWFAWTEDRTNALANTWRRKKEKTRQALSMAVRQLVGLKDSPNNISERLAGLMGFELDDELLLSDDKISFEVNPIYDALIEKIGEKNVRYLRPGYIDDKQRRQPGLLIDSGCKTHTSFGGVRMYVLGPPENFDAMNAADPTSDKWKTSFQLQPDYFGGDFSFGQSQPLNDLDEQSRDFWHYVRKAPFDDEFVLPIDLKNGELPPDALHSVGERPTPVSRRVEEHFNLLKKSDVYTHYFDEQWRQINYDYLLSADNLAIKFNANVNNTSLVLAIEIEQTGEVLFFPGDAETGVWQAWDNDQQLPDRLYTWPLKTASDDVANDKGEKKKYKTVEDLLAATVLYKVGHHGSHNATPKSKGIDKLTHPDLSAIIPVDHNVAARYGWDGIPFGDLLNELQNRNVPYVRADTLTEAMPTDKCLGSGAQVSWETDKKLYVDWTISFPEK